MLKLTFKMFAGQGQPQAFPLGWQIKFMLNDPLPFQNTSARLSIV